jgi:hypothetical protein
MPRREFVETRFVSEREVITRICALTGDDEATLRKRAYGPPRKPALRPNIPQKQCRSPSSLPLRTRSLTR